MWIFNLDGFFSVVEDARHSSRVVVRARYQRDLVTVAKKLGLRKVIATPYRDYPFRVFVPKERWVAYLARSAAEINYTNFKDAALKQEAPRRSDQYHEVWATMAGWQEDPEEVEYGERDPVRPMRVDDPKE